MCLEYFIYKQMKQVVKTLQYYVLNKVCFKDKIRGITGLVFNYLI